MSAVFPAGDGVSGLQTSLDIQDRTASVSFLTSPAVLILPTAVVKQGNIDYNATTGVITFGESRVWHLDFYANIVIAAGRTIYSYADIDTGAGWVTSQYSGRKIGLAGAVRVISNS